ncbi:FAD-dependent oxidoreductase [Bradyrhizobium sp. 200]|uniref:FAD-dependent oxidoreductase n=1 Tax=Bradyrhizobium sp. 200 TaxID=2782665 RepID=UPI00200042F9|nr:FAD-dependent oxidoreductase [Bradyrhizobium sp. 200]
MDAKIRSQHEMKVVVIGAGILGLMTALEIQRTSRQVVIVDPGKPRRQTGCVLRQRRVD